MIQLASLTMEDVENARAWRDAAQASLRTPHALTKEMQEAFYRDVVCRRDAPHRYWAVRLMGTGRRIGMGGLTNIQWENGIAEISLILAPSEIGKGDGEEAASLLLKEAFDRMGLRTVCGECYHCSPARGFWRRVVAAHCGTIVILPRRKRWDGRLWGADYFTIIAPTEREKDQPGCASQA